MFRAFLSFSSYNVKPSRVTVATGGLVIFLTEFTDLARARGRNLSSVKTVLLKTDAPRVEVAVRHGFFVSHGLYIDDLKVKPLMLVIVAVW